ncbi:pyruvate, phosphate dikinase [Tumebacillus lipolyticus]|uniref:Pyruvate, phosphate dikinase n=1 Tax=Tumebacillus lipolyticus TaxID=1280370 RepID=A0ABW5A0U6_9BACL
MIVFLDHEGDVERRSLGNKGARLIEMKRAGLRVPDGFILTTEACRHYFQAGRTLTSDLKERLLTALCELERRTGKRLGDPQAPLLLAIRSGAPVSMPGMMDTLLNVGLQDEVVQGLADRTGDCEFALDCQSRFQEAYGELVAPEIPDDPIEQLLQAVSSVFASWNGRRAAVYRQVNRIPDDLGTAVIVQEMVFGNWGERSGSGVVFSRHPASGERELFGEVMLRAQGEAVVAGKRTPSDISCLQQQLPDVYEELSAVATRLEEHDKDMQEIEFTFERGTLYLLQSRVGERTALAAVKIAVDLCQAGVIDRQTALQRVGWESLQSLLQPELDPNVDAVPLVVGLPVVPGAVCGEIALDRERAIERSAGGHPVLLIRRETDPNDYEAMLHANGILTAFGGMTSHAAVTARPLGKPCIVGCANLAIDLLSRQIEIAGRTFREGEWLTLDGTTGRVFAGRLPLVAPELPVEVETFRSWRSAR